MTFPAFSQSVSILKEVENHIRLGTHDFSWSQFTEIRVHFEVNGALQVLVSSSERLVFGPFYDARTWGCRPPRLFWLADHVPSGDKQPPSSFSLTQSPVRIHTSTRQPLDSFRSIGGKWPGAIITSDFSVRRRAVKRVLVSPYFSCIS